MKTLIIKGNDLLDWIAYHEQVWEDMVRYFNPEGKDYEKIIIVPAEFYITREDNEIIKY